MPLTTLASKAQLPPPSRQPRSLRPGRIYILASAAVLASKNLRFCAAYFRVEKLSALSRKPVVTKKTAQVALAPTFRYRAALGTTLLLPTPAELSKKGG